MSHSYHTSQQSLWNPHHAHGDSHSGPYAAYPREPGHGHSHTASEMHASLPHFNWDSHKLKRRRYVVLPWMVDPTSGAKQETRHDGRHTLVFAQRHEANTMELFFDLFFVANLALFTQYHSIVNHVGFLTYVEFFGLLWGTWFSITLYDVRFALDSVYERGCKLIQFAVFVVFALVGSEFEPGGEVADPKDNVNFRTLSFALCASRALLMVQYLVVLSFCVKRGFMKLVFPLGLNAFWYLVTTVVFGAMSLAFPSNGQLHKHIYLVWYVAMGLEIICVLSVSTIWRTLSFKLTHLAERMSLLTLIIMGEGIIGITKTISIILAKTPNLEYYGLVLVILLLIYWLYFIYFDNTPKGHFGTIRQQLWAFLHFPLHLSIVGIVEGAQQLVRARYVIDNDTKFNKSVYQYCFKEHLDGEKLQEKLYDTIEYFQFYSKAASNQFVPVINDALYRVGNSSDICSDENLQEHYANEATNMTSQYPGALEELWEQIASAIYASAITDKQVPDFDDPLHSSTNSWQVAYYYFWGAIALFSFTTLMTHFLCRKSKRDILTYMGVFIRVFVMIIAIFLGAYAAANEQFFIAFMSTTGVVPVAMSCLFLIVLVDSAGRMFSNLALRHASGDVIDDEEEAAHEHGHGEEHHDDLKGGHEHSEHHHWYNGGASAAYLPPTPGSAPIGYAPVANPMASPPLEQQHTAYNNGYNMTHSRHPSEQAYDNPNFRSTSGLGGTPNLV